MQAFIDIETDDGYEITIEIDFTYSYSPAVLDRAPEDCYPEEESFEWGDNESHEKYNALEWWAISNITEDRAFDVCVEAIA